MHPNPTNKLVRTHSAPFWCWDKPRATLDSLDSPRPGLRGSHHLPPYSLQLSAALASKWLFFLGLPKWSPESVPVWTPGTLNAHNSSPQTRIGTRSKPKL